MAPADDLASSPPATAVKRNPASTAADPVTCPLNKEESRDFSEPADVVSQSAPHSHSVAKGTSSATTPDYSSSQDTSSVLPTSSGRAAPVAERKNEEQSSVVPSLPLSTSGNTGESPPSSGAQEQRAPAPARHTASATTVVLHKSEQMPQKQMKPPPRIVYDLPSAPVATSCDSSRPPPPNSVCDGNMADKAGGSVGERCCLDAADSHIDLEISPDGLQAACLHTDGFQYTWKGVRSTYGVSGSTGQYYFEVKVVGSPAVVMPETPLSTQNVCRIGVSQPFSSLFLGESGESWGFGGTAKKSHARKFENYGQSYGLNDVVGVIVDLQNLKLSFMKNGSFLGAAYTLPPRVRDTGLFPHLYLKNVDVKVNFQAATAWFPPPNQQIQFIGDLPPHALLPNKVEHPRHVGECEFIMMVGLPACGKTYWAERHCMQNPAKSYVLLGTNAVIDQMRVMGVRRQANYASRWEELMSTATAVFNGLVARAGSGANPRNVIIDQTNVYRNARRRKVQPFLAWGIRRAVTIVNDEYTLQQRTQKREQEEGKFVPVAAVKEMEAAFCLPQLDDGFTVIDYPELPEMESRQQVRRYNEDGRRFKRENPNAMGNQAKPHMEKRKPEEFLSAAELYPDKKRGRISIDDQQQQYCPGGPGGAGGGCGSDNGGVGGRGGSWAGGGRGARAEDFYGGGHRGGNDAIGDGGGGRGGGGPGGGSGGQLHWRQQHAQRQQQNHMCSSEREQQQQCGWQQGQQQEGVRTVGYYQGQSREGNGDATYQYDYQSSNQRDYSASVSGAVCGEVRYDSYACAGRGGDGREGLQSFQTVRTSGRGGGYYYGGDGRGARGSGYQQTYRGSLYQEAGEGSTTGGGRGRAYYVESSSYAGRSCGPHSEPMGKPVAATSREDGYYPSASRSAGPPGDYMPGRNLAAPGNPHAANPHHGGIGMLQQQEAWINGRFRGGGGGLSATGPGRRY